MPEDTKFSQWIERLEAGQEDAFEYIITHFSPLLKRVVNRFAPTPVDKEEWLELVLLHVFDRILSGKFEYISVAAFESWLYRLAEHKCLEFWRRWKHGRERITDHTKLEAIPDPKAVPPQAGLEQSELRRILTEAIEEVPKPEWQKILHMVWIEGFTAEEAAFQLCRSINTIRTWERRGKIVLREILERKYPVILESYADC